MLSENKDKIGLELTSMDPILRDPVFLRINDYLLGSNCGLSIFSRLALIVEFFLQTF